VTVAYTVRTFPLVPFEHGALFLLPFRAVVVIVSLRLAS